MRISNMTEKRLLMRKRYQSFGWKWGNSWSVTSSSRESDRRLPALPNLMMRLLLMKIEWDERGRHIAEPCSSQFCRGWVLFQSGICFAGSKTCSVMKRSKFCISLSICSETSASSQSKPISRSVRTMHCLLQGVLCCQDIDIGVGGKWGWSASRRIIPKIMAVNLSTCSTLPRQLLEHAGS